MNSLSNLMQPKSSDTVTVRESVATVDQRRGMVICLVDDIEREILDAHSQLQRLVERLQPVIGTVTAGEPEVTTKEPITPFPLGNRLLEVKQSVKTMRLALTELNRRVEI